MATIEGLHRREYWFKDLPSDWKIAPAAGAFTYRRKCILKNEGALPSEIGSGFFVAGMVLFLILKANSTAQLPTR